MLNMKILVTGGTGFIGSHTLVELYASGHEAVVIDNLCNSTPVALKRVEELVGNPMMGPPTNVITNIQPAGAAVGWFYAASVASVETVYHPEK